MEPKNKKSKMNRRDFIKMSSLTAAGAAFVGANIASASEEKKEDKEKGKRQFFSLSKREYQTIDEAYEIAKDYQRMDQKNTIFCRGVWDRPLDEPEGLLKSFFAKWTGLIPNAMDSEPGFSALEHALCLASWASCDIGTPFSSGGIRNRGPFNNWETHANPKVQEKHKFKNKAEASLYVKRASRFLGAGQVGIAPYDERWVYSKWYDFADTIFDPSIKPIHEDAVFPFKPKSVISVAFEMDYDAVKSPGYLMDTAAGLEYSHMAENTHKIALFLNHLGYKAIPCGNDTAMSIPIAAQAGIGELSRMGTLITEKFGSRVRLAKVFTDLEMEVDKPITFGVQEFCKRCMKCADLCPSKAISTERDPSAMPTTGSKSSHPGVKKWFHNNERCFGQWEKFGAACGVCIGVCPYNKLDTWAHHVAKLAVGVPVGRDIARQLDDAFGYGKMKPENVEKFWSNLDEK